MQERPQDHRDTELCTQTQAVRGGLTRSQFHETAEALYLTSGYAYPTAADAEAAFAGHNNHMRGCC